MEKGKGLWLPASEAAKKARIDLHYLHKLIKKGELEAYHTSKGQLKYWHVNIECSRYQKLLSRKLNKPSAETPTLQAYTGHLYEK